ncbi:hypothetical protein V8G54_033144 [Vigna mungo]|uniref:Uncharacterized protein n=1 Tax=Vigna mungo TaxID=3915 RepID=A0AAQ3MNE8_VIGMU
MYFINTTKRWSISWFYSFELTCHGVIVAQIWPLQLLQKQERTVKTTDWIFTRKYAKRLHGVKLKFKEKENGKTTINTLTVRPLLIKAFTNTSFESTSNFFCSSPYKRHTYS